MTHQCNNAPLHWYTILSPTSTALSTQEEPHHYIYLLSVFAYLLSLFTAVTLFSYHLHTLLSPPPLRCRTRSAKQFHTKQWKIFGYCFLYCRLTALSEAQKQLRPREATYSALAFHHWARITINLYFTHFMAVGCHQKTPMRTYMNSISFWYKMASYA